MIFLDLKSHFVLTSKTRCVIFNHSGAEHRASGQPDRSLTTREINRGQGHTVGSLQPSTMRG